MEIEKQGFYESYDEGHVAEVSIKVKCDGDLYRVTAGVDQQGDGDPNAMFDAIERKTGRGFKGKMGTEDVTAIVTVLDFCEDFCHEKGYDFRGPAVGPQ